MTHDIVIEDTEFLGAVKHRNAVVEIDDYDEGGELMTANDFGLNRFQWRNLELIENGPYNPVYDEEQGRLFLWDTTDGTEADEGTETTLRFVAAGK